MIAWAMESERIQNMELSKCLRPRLCPAGMFGGDKPLILKTSFGGLSPSCQQESLPGSSTRSEWDSPGPHSPLIPVGQRQATELIFRRREQKIFHNKDISKFDGTSKMEYVPRDFCLLVFCFIHTEPNSQTVQLEIKFQFL